MSVVSLKKLRAAAHRANRRNGHNMTRFTIIDQRVDEHVSSYSLCGTCNMLTEVTRYGEILGNAHMYRCHLLKL